MRIFPSFCLLAVILLCDDAFCIEERVYCSRIRPTNLSLRVSSSTLNYGKWIMQPPFYEAIEGPDGKTVGPGGELRICAAGRAMSPTGTEGEMVVSTMEGQRFLTIRWDEPYYGTSSSDFFFPREQFRVVRRWVQWGHTYTVTKL